MMIFEQNMVVLIILNFFESCIC